MEFTGRVFKSHSDQLSIATSINSAVVCEHHLHQFIPLNSCDCLSPEYNYFKTDFPVETMLRQAR